VVTAAVEAAGAGADIISIADTAGHMIPGTKRSMFDYVGRLRAALDQEGLQPRIAVHCHNDRGLAVANALDAFRAGADIIDVSVLGLGERAGITDLATLTAVLAADFSLAGRWKLEVLPRLYRTVSRYAGVPVPVNSPVVGANAFTHCAGVHTQAALRNPTHYQSLDPSPYGREPVICLDHMSGMSALRHSLDRIGEDQAGLSLDRVLARVKEVGEAGRTVDFEELRLIVDYCRDEPAPGCAAAGGAA
jgi:2-isopropylmalate synthase